MRLNKVRWIILITNGLFLLIDQMLKWHALHDWATPKLLFANFGWQLFLNRGVAFGLPLSNSLTILVTLPMIALLVYLFYKELTKKTDSVPNLALAWAMVLAGAISNLLDRIIYHQVVDYFMIGTAVINLGDALIIGGLFMYLFTLETKEKNPTIIYKNNHNVP